MSNDTIACPACGSSAVRKFKETHEISEPHSASRTLELELYRCDACGSEGDFSGQADSAIAEAMESSKHDSVRSMIADMEHGNGSMASIERALELPQRTLVKWKSGRAKPSASAVALLRMVRTFPWLIEVADNGYDYDFAQKIHIQHAVSSLLHSTTFYQENASGAGLITSSQGVVLYAYFDKDDAADTEFACTTQTIACVGVNKRSEPVLGLE